MERVARLDDATLVPGRGFTLSPAIDAKLRQRIRSSLISRTLQNPPRIPCPSLDNSNLQRDTEEDPLDYFPVHTDTHKFSPEKAVAKRSGLESNDSAMGALRFDGPAGQIQDSDSRFYSRRPSQPITHKERRSRFDGGSSPPQSGLDQRAQGGVLGREASKPVSLGRAKSTTSAGSRLPRFHLRTVAPATDVNKITRPAPQHVPGSYRSEVATPRDPKALPEEQHHKAVDALQDVIKHDQHIGVPHDPNPGDTSEALAIPSKLLKQPHHIPIKAFPDHAGITSAAQPVLTPSGDHKNPHEQASDIPVFVIGDERDGEDAGNQEAGPHTPLQGPELEPLDGPKISDLLAGLPPVRQSTADDIAEHHLTARPSSDHEKPSTNTYSNSFPREQSMIIDADENLDNPLSPLLPNSLSTDTRRSSAQDAKPSSRRSSKISPVSRAMSMLSEFSARSGYQTPSLRSFGRQKPDISADQSNLTARPNHRVFRAVRTAERQRVNRHPARKGYNSLADQHQHGTESTTGTIVLQKQHKREESFTRVITDLESLLKEALSIAGNAASHDEYHLAERNRSASSSEAMSSESDAVDEEANHTTLPKQQLAAGQREHVTINEPERDALYQGKFKKARDATPYPAQTRQTSTVPNLDEERPQAEIQHQNTNRSTNREFLELPRTSSKSGSLMYKPLYHQPFQATDWAPFKVPKKPSQLRLQAKPPPLPQAPPTIRAPAKEQRAFLLRDHGGSDWSVTRDSIRDYVRANERPPIEPRVSSVLNLKRLPKQKKGGLSETHRSDESDCECVPYIADFKTSGLHYHPVYREAMAGEPSQAPRQGPFGIQPRHDTITSLRGEQADEPEKSRSAGKSADKDYTLEGRHHFSIREPRGFSLSRSHRRSPIARDWSTIRKRYVATVTCITTAFMGLIIGIYAGEVPAIQYAIADEHHYTILGNVFFFLGLAITTALFYPLPLLHGRKPYTLAALAILLPLQFPQALAINSDRTPYVATYRVGLLVPRMFAGLVMGFANINFITTLLDLFGSSLQSGNPHQETVNQNDVRRHGGGMGLWLSIWTWSAIGSIGIGFLIGAGIISHLNVSWGYWVTIILNAAVLVLNVLSPEVRRSAYRRSMAEVRNGGEVSRRVARGEIKMHLRSTGPIWWWEEVFEGHVLAIRMLKQPGFFVLSLYLGWIYGQVVLVIVVSQPQRLKMFDANDFRSYSGRYCRNTIGSTHSTLGCLSQSFPLALF